MQLDSTIQSEYERFLSYLDTDETTAPGTLSSKDVLKAHFLVANQFYLEGEGLGGLGPKSMDLLQSAVHRQHTAFGAHRKWTTPYEICATLFFGLIMNHPFHDANKRTAFLCALLFLRNQGYCPSVDEKVFEDFTVEIADNQLAKYDRYKLLKKEKHPDPEVAYIAYFLRKNTRRVDKTNYTVTYRELNTILNRFGCGLEHPNNNHIDIYKTVKKKPFLGLGRVVSNYVKVGQIGFPRWTDEVGKEALKTVRAVTDLDYAQNNVDSAEFFKGLDPVQQLITTYSEAMRSLAFR